MIESIDAIEFTICFEQVGSAESRMTVIYSQLASCACVTARYRRVNINLLLLDHMAPTTRSNGAVHNVGIEDSHVCCACTGIRSLK